MIPNRIGIEKISARANKTEDSIRAHLFLCMVALTIQKHLEQAVGFSLRRIRDVLLSVTDITFTDSISGRTFIKRSEPSAAVKGLIAKLSLSD